MKDWLREGKEGSKGLVTQNYPSKGRPPGNTLIAKTRGGTGHRSAVVLVVGLCLGSGRFGRRLACMALCRAGRIAVVVREHSEQFGRDAVALVESASFPNGQVVADLGISRSSLQVWPREGPACLARPVALACSHAIAPPWAPPRPDAPPGREKSTCARQRPMERQNGRPQHRPAGGFRLVSQRAVDSPPGWGHRLAQSFTCDRGSQSRTAAFTAMITTHEPGLFHGSRRRRRPGRSHGNPSFRPRLELIRAFLLTGLDPIDSHNIPLSPTNTAPSREPW